MAIWTHTGTGTPVSGCERCALAWGIETTLCRLGWREREEGCARRVSARPPRPACSPVCPCADRRQSIACGGSSCTCRLLLWCDRRCPESLFGKLCMCVFRRGVCVCAMCYCFLGNEDHCWNKRHRKENINRCTHCWRVYNFTFTFPTEGRAGNITSIEKLSFKNVSKVTYI